MSLESKIETLTAAVQQLTAVLQAQGVSVPQTAAPVQPAPVAAPVQQAVQMPAPPVFTAPTPAPVAAPAPAGAPFSDGNGLIQYVMGAYQAMGPQKGANIQGVLTSLGYSNINDVKPEHYAALYQGVEQLKVS